METNHANKSRRVAFEAIANRKITWAMSFIDLEEASGFEYLLRDDLLHLFAFEVYLTTQAATMPAMSMCEL